MATTLNIETTYAGEFAGKYIGMALLSANTIDKGGVTVMANIKYRETVKRFDATNLIKDASCDFTATGDIVLSERILEPKELDVNVLLCKKDFRSDWEAVSMGYSAFDVLPKNFQDFLLARLLGQVAEANEISLWQGFAANSGQYEGFLSILDTTPPPVGQVIAGTTIDYTNVLDELDLVTSAIPDRLWGKEGLKIFVPRNVAKAYVRALGGFGSGGFGAAGTNATGTQWYQEGSGLSFNGVSLFVANGLPSNVMVATTTENLAFGCGLQNDTNTVKFIDMADIDGSENVRFVMRWTAGTQVGIIEDCVTYGVAAWI